jgi:hypothetical protein
MLLDRNVFVNATVSHAARWSENRRGLAELGNTYGGERLAPLSAVNP